jgi:hypothetical protein
LDYDLDMKVIPVEDAQGNLSRIIADVVRGESVILKDGDNEVTLYPGRALDLEADSPELEAELLKGIDGPVAPYSAEEMHAACEDAARRLRKK